MSNTELPTPLTEIATLGASPLDYGQQDLARIRKALDGSLFWFCCLIFNYKDLSPELHGTLCQYIEEWGNPGYRRIMTQIPREFFKTSVGTRGNALWQITKEPNKPVAIFNERDTNAKKWLKSIRDVVQSNLLFQQVYRDLLPPGIAKNDTRSTPRWWKWSDEQLDFEGRDVGEPEASISAHGIEAATTGGHWPKLILDDLISVKHKQSEPEMERAREWVRTHIYLMRPAELGWAYCNNTPWTFHDIYTLLLKDYDYRLYRRSALELADGSASLAGESIFPTKLTTEHLRVMYHRDPFTFNAQMLCLPQPGKEQHFNIKWKRYGTMDYHDKENPQFVISHKDYDPEIGWEGEGEPKPPSKVYLHDMTIAGILDPAPSEATDKRQTPNARNGLLIEGLDAWGRRYILEAFAFRAGYRDVIDKLFALAEKWGFNTWLIEEVNFSNVYRHWIQDDQRLGGRHEKQYLRCVAVEPGKRNKDTRIMDKAPGWQQGRYYLNTAGCEAFEQEFDEYPSGLTKDLLDAMGYDHKIHKPESPLEQANRTIRDTGLGLGTKDPVTGY